MEWLLLSDTIFGVVSSEVESLMDLERLVSNPYEEVPQFVLRSDAENNQRLVGIKRSSTDSAFPSLAREAMARIGTNSNENSHLMKGSSQMKRGLLVLHPGKSCRNDATVTKQDRLVSMNVGPTVQFPPRIRKSPMVPSTFPNRFGEVQAGGSPTMSQTAADEGSRTGIKGPGILSSRTAGVETAKNSSGLASPADRAVMTRSIVNEPEASSSPSQNGMRPESRQMTIFCGGQAHVFDDVDLNKADVIMALALSNGGSWSTIYSPKPKPELSNEGGIIIKENSSGGPNNLAFVPDSCKNPPATRDPVIVVGSRDGGHGYLSGLAQRMP